MCFVGNAIGFSRWGVYGAFFLCAAAFLSCDDGADGSDGTEDFVGVAKEHADAVGDIIFADGSAFAYSGDLVLSDAQKARAVAVVFYADGEDGPLGARTLAVGLRHDKSGRAWCDPSAKAFSWNLPGVVCTGERMEDGSYTFSGDTDGADNLRQLGLGDTYIDWRYPAFYFAVNYRDEFSRVKDTAYESGWYLPTVAELYELWRNRDVVEAALSAAGGDTFGPDNYWSSSVDGVDGSCATRLLFAYGRPDSSCKKHYERCVCAIREF